MLNATNANERADKIALTPLRRLGQPIEVAYGVLFLASDEFREVWFGADDMAQALRARVMPLFAEDPLRIPDFIGAGPDAPRDEAARSMPSIIFGL